MKDSVKIRQLISDLKAANSDICRTEEILGAHKSNKLKIQRAIGEIIDTHRRVANNNEIIRFVVDSECFYVQTNHHGGYIVQPCDLDIRFFE